MFLTALEIRLALPFGKNTDFLFGTVIFAPMEWYEFSIAFFGSAIAGAINTLAGNGSAITLTILTEVLGLPGNVANGTNRLGVFTQSTAGTYAFYKNGKLNIRRSWVYIFPTIIGAIIGILVAIWIDNASFRRVFRGLMVVMLLVILVKPKRWLRETDASAKLPLWISLPVFLALGFYGGFIQMGMGVFFLAAMVLLAKYSIIQGNAVKLFVVGVYTVAAIALFQWQGLIDWKIAAIMAVGQGLGGYYTAHYASLYPQANVWAYRVLVVVIFLAIAKLFDLHLLLFS